MRYNLSKPFQYYIERKPVSNKKYREKSFPIAEKNVKI